MDVFKWINIYVTYAVCQPVRLHLLTFLCLILEGYNKEEVGSLYKFLKVGGSQ